MLSVSVNNLHHNARDSIDRLKLNYIDDIMSKCDFFSNDVVKQSSLEENLHIFQELCRVVHSMKGTAAMYEIHMISAICHRFEDFLLGNNVVRDLNNDAVVDRILQYLDLINLSAAIEREHIPA